MRTSRGFKRETRLAMIGIGIVFASAGLFAQTTTNKAAKTEAATSEAASSNRNSSAPTRQTAGRNREFSPTEKISQDYAVDFPVDI